MKYTIHLHKNVEASQPFHFTVNHPNGEVIALSENYKTEQGMLDTLKGFGEALKEEPTIVFHYE